MFWAASELPPFRPWTLAGWSGVIASAGTLESPQILVACLTYLAIVAASSRGLIGMPIFRQLQARAEELRGIAESGCFPPGDRARLTAKINRAEKVGARRVRGFELWVPLPDVLGANQRLNSIEKHMLSDLADGDLRLAASQIAALLPATEEAKAAADKIAAVVTAIEQGELQGTQADSELRNAAATALIVLHRQRDLPQELEVNHIRVSIWLTMVGLAATYALGVTWPGHEQIMIAGALGGLLGSLSALITNTALAAAVLLGFSGGLFSRIAVAGTAPLLAGGGKPDGSSGTTLVPARSTTDENRTGTPEATSNGHQPDRPVPAHAEHAGES